MCYCVNTITTVVLKIFKILQNDQNLKQLFKELNVNKVVVQIIDREVYVIKTFVKVFHKLHYNTNV